MAALAAADAMLREDPDPDPAVLCDDEHIPDREDPDPELMCDEHKPDSPDPDPDPAELMYDEHIPDPEKRHFFLYKKRKRRPPLPCTCAARPSRHSWMGGCATYSRTGTSSRFQEYIHLWGNGRLRVEVPDDIREQLKQDMVKFAAAHFPEV